jgi:hypothetical protein
MRRRCAFTLIGLRHFWRRMITGGFTVPVVWKAAKARPCSKPSLQVVGKIFPGPTTSLDVHALLGAAVCDEHTRAAQLVHYLHDEGRNFVAGHDASLRLSVANAGADRASLHVW